MCHVGLELSMHCNLIAYGQPIDKYSNANLLFLNLSFYLLNFPYLLRIDKKCSVYVYLYWQEGHKWLKSVHKYNDKPKPAIVAWETVSYDLYWDFFKNKSISAFFLPVACIPLIIITKCACTFLLIHLLSLTYKKKYQVVIHLWMS